MKWKKSSDSILGFVDLEKTYFSDGLKKLEHCWVKCIELKCCKINHHLSKMIVFILWANYLTDHTLFKKKNLYIF